MTRKHALFALVFLTSSVVFAQQVETNPLTVSQAVERAVEKFPAVGASVEQVNVAVAGIRIARTNYLPSVNALGQVNRATRNNVFGLLLPQTVIPNISGPVLGTNDGSTVWGSAVGVLVSWEPFDFGRRRALVQSAEATQTHAELTTTRTKFEVANTTAAAVLTFLASEQAVRAARAAVDRAQILVRSVKALVGAQLRPGADLSRADTELDAAQTQLIQAQQSVELAKATVAEYTGVDVKSVGVAPGRLLQLPPEANGLSADFTAHPLAREQNAAVEESEARLKVLERTYRPKFDLQVGASARGTGALTNGGTLGGGNGLGPNYFNADAGLTVTFPILALPSIRAQEAQEAALGRSASATYRQRIIELQAQWNAAEATLRQARRIADVTPKEVQDARTGFEQANAQYRAGLTNIVAVAEAQRLLAQAEMDDALAKLAVWRAVLEQQSAQGDISNFLAEASK